jgi:uncharacterized protein YndB with AHSA1/START domain
MDARRGTDRRLAIDAVGEREIVMRRSFAAPRPLVFAAWTDPQQVPLWMGGRSWTMPVCRIDLRVGGAWRFVLVRGSDGARMGISGVYQEVEAPRRLVTTEAWDDGSGEPTRGRLEMFEGDSMVSYAFDERDGVTTLTMTMRYPTREVRDRMLGSGMEHGANEAYATLDDLLAGGKDATSGSA